MITKVDVARDMRRVYCKISNLPTEKQYKEHGQYSTHTVRKCFDSLANAREAAGLNRGHEATDKDKLAVDLRRVAEIVDRTPSQKEYREHGKWSVRTVHNKFESWIAAREYAGFEGGPTAHKTLSNEELIEEVQRMAEEIGHVPSQTEMREDGEYSDIVYYERFGSWTAAIRECGFEPRKRGAQPGEENPSWKGGSIESYYGPNWKEQRERRLEVDEYECQHCGMTEAEHQQRWGQGLNVHHIKARREFLDNGQFDWEAANHIQNLVALCNCHHEQYEGTDLRPHNVPSVVA